ncbi:MAG: hypothetical protein AAGF11_14200 [Myxococcota bacterium]
MQHIAEHEWRQSQLAINVLMIMAMTLARPIHSPAALMGSRTGSSAPAEESNDRPTEEDTPESAKLARRYATSFDTRTKEEQIGLEGEYEINLAIDQYKIAQNLRPGDLIYLEEEITLLERFAHLRAEAQHEGKGEGMPPALAHELARAHSDLNRRRRIHEEAAQAAQAVIPKETVRLAEETVKAESQVDAESEPVEPEPVEPEPGEAQPVPPEPQRRNMAILSSGIVLFVGGASLVGVGAWNRRTVDQRSGEKLGTVDAAPGGTDDMRTEFIGEIMDWRQQWRGIGTGQVVGGALLSVAGVCLTTWSAIRTRRARRSIKGSMSAGPSSLRRGIGLQIVGKF